MANLTPPIEYILVQIDEIDMPQRVAHARDKTGVLLQVSFRDQPGGFMLVPSQGELWTAFRKGFSWHLDKRLDNDEDYEQYTAQMNPGDARIKAAGAVNVFMQSTYMNERAIGPTIRDFYSQGVGYTSVTLTHEPVALDVIHPTLNGLAVPPALWSFDFTTRILTFSQVMGLGELLVTYQTWMYNKDDAATVTGHGGPSATEDYLYIYNPYGDDLWVMLALRRSDVLLPDVFGSDESLPKIGLAATKYITTIARSSRAS